MSIQQAHFADPNVAVCTTCRDAGRAHEIREIPAGPAPRWGGAPSHRRRCTGCGAKDGPCVKEADVHAGL